MSIVYALIIGLVVGTFAGRAMPERDAGGSATTALVGLAGSMLALFIVRAAGWYTHEGPLIVASVIGAMIVLAAYRVVVAHRETS